MTEPIDVIKFTGHSCHLPGTAFRRLNSVWSCPECGKLWALRIWMGMSGSLKEWSTALHVTSEGKCGQTTEGLINMGARIGPCVLVFGHGSAWHKDENGVEWRPAKKPEGANDDPHATSSS